MNRLYCMSVSVLYVANTCRKRSPPPHRPTIAPFAQRKGARASEARRATDAQSGGCEPGPRSGPPTTNTHHRSQNTKRTNNNAPFAQRKGARASAAPRAGDARGGRGRTSQTTNTHHRGQNTKPTTTNAPFAQRKGARASAAPRAGDARRGAGASTKRPPHPQAITHPSHPLHQTIQQGLKT